MAMMRLALQDGKSPPTLAILAREQGISVSYLE
jgi:DNA-binding IscR family transcriptional regulator